MREIRVQGRVLCPNGKPTLLVTVPRVPCIDGEVIVQSLNAVKVVMKWVVDQGRNTASQAQITADDCAHMVIADGTESPSVVTFGKLPSGASLVALNYGAVLDGLLHVSAIW